jgi:hypothetical protein
MADPWELILHHSYTGTPGVIFDQSPARGSHGVGVGLTDDDFHVDGATVGSGAVSFGPGKRIRVPITSSWRPCIGVKVEVVCICDESTGGTLIDGPGFTFEIHNGVMTSSFATLSGGGGGQTTLNTPARVPVGEWATVAWMWDGFTSSSFSLNGEVVLQLGASPLGSDRMPVKIGVAEWSPNQFRGEFTGRIDDIKVWRVNPRRVDDEFTDRPVDDAVRDCWKQWGRDFVKLMQADPDCAETTMQLMLNAMAASLDEVMSAGEPLRTQLMEAARRYRQLWGEGRLDEIPAVLADFLAAVRRAGVDPIGIGEFDDFRQNPCVQKIFDQIPVPDCDKDFVDMINGVTVEE